MPKGVGKQPPLLFDGFVAKPISREAFNVFVDSHGDNHAGDGKQQAAYVEDDITAKRGWFCWFTLDITTALRYCKGFLASFTSF